MVLTIIRPDGVVGVDGYFLPIDLSALPTNLRVVQWNGNTGHEEWTNKANTNILSVSSYSSYVAAWNLKKSEIDAKASDPYYGLSKEERLLVGLSAIDQGVQAKQALPFLFNGHNYYPDTELIQGVFSALSLLPSNYTEVWKTADKEADGITNVYVTLDKTGIAGLAAAYLLFRKGIWAEGEEKKKLLKAQYLQEV